MSPLPRTVQELKDAILFVSYAPLRQYKNADSLNASPNQRLLSK